MKLSSTQYFILLALALVILSAGVYLGKVDTSILVGVILSTMGIGATITGVHIGVPLSAAPTITPDASPAPAQPVKIVEAAG